MLWHGGKHLLESALVPAGLFYLLLTVAGFGFGVVAALTWSLVAIGFRVARRKPIPAVLLVTTGLLIARTVVGLMTGSVFLYFLQPTLQNFLFALLFLASAPLNRPLLARLADDFCAFPDALTKNPRVHHFFQRVSLLWAFVFAANGAATLLMLAKATLGDYLLVSTAGSYSLVMLGALCSLLWFRRALRRDGIVLHLGRRAA
ncbi:MAG: VC0807 family protein [Candidatus Dormiibacterota bacterium]